MKLTQNTYKHSVEGFELEITGAGKKTGNYKKH